MLRQRASLGSLCGDAPNGYSQMPYLPRKQDSGYWAFLPAGANPRMAKLHRCPVYRTQRAAEEESRAILQLLGQLEQQETWSELIIRPPKLMEPEPLIAKPAMGLWPVPKQIRTPDKWQKDNDLWVPRHKAQPTKGTYPTTSMGAYVPMEVTHFRKPPSLDCSVGQKHRWEDAVGTPKKKIKRCTLCGEIKYESRIPLRGWYMEQVEGIAITNARSVKTYKSNP